MKKIGSTLLIVLFFLTGLCLLFYPTVSGWYNERVGSYVVSNYRAEVEDTSEEDAQVMLEEARAFNAALSGSITEFAKGSPQEETYINTLNVYDGMMGAVIIDKINVNLPIYHGTDESVLQKGVGHLEGSALPTGDEGNHVVLTGHTGLPSATLFTQLDQLVIGDTFVIEVLGESYTYEIYDILVVEPYEVDSLVPVEGKDLVTLVTCTPYGVNSHRLLVQGERIEVQQVASQEETDATDDATQTAESWLSQLPSYFPMACFASVLGVLFLLLLILPTRKKKQGKHSKASQQKNRGNANNTHHES